MLLLLIDGGWSTWDIADSGIGCRISRVGLLFGCLIGGVLNKCGIERVSDQYIMKHDKCE